ncbi:VOC family protein [Desulfosediminicola sp.]|uniref:VOC family protein n=1 Tax=Desulfosediminicola sp. TaxID=2886825 RepID=UPI003AF2D69B
MQVTNSIHGIHHITAITGSAPENLTFMEQVLGLRLVKQTVNFDDPFTYHLYYGDHQGNPGTIVTFFPWENAPKGRPGPGMISSIAFTIPWRAFGYWQEHLRAQGIDVIEQQRFSETVLQFSDSEGLTYELITCDHQEYNQNGIIGLHSVTALATSLDHSRGLLEDTMSMGYVGEEAGRHRFALKSPDRSIQYYDVLLTPELPDGLQGRGTVHHIAFRCSSDSEQREWQERLLKRDYPVSPVRDRKYFRSIYFREPGGVLFEIATDPPGFAVDEDIVQLGMQLQLPGEYEPMRGEIEKRLAPLRAVEYIYTYSAPPKPPPTERTIVAFHGTGGDEHDLIPLARTIAPDAAIISPRGQVTEHGMKRFFRRFSSGVFDEDDIRKRSEDLNSFLGRVSLQYRRNPQQLIALGYSNGANIAAALLLLHPQLFGSAILVRPMLPITVPVPVDLTGHNTLILKGTEDRIIPAASTDKLIDTLRQYGARVHVAEIQADHNITPTDIEIARKWLQNRQSTEPATA